MNVRMQFKPAEAAAAGTEDANSLLAALGELKAAHQIIRNALAIMTTEQKVEWGRLNARDGVDGEGITRANEREAVLAKA